MAALIIVTEIWGSMFEPWREPTASILVAMNLWVVFRMSLALGPAAQDRVRRKFQTAAQANASTFRIGGVKWSISDGEFRRVIYANENAILHHNESWAFRRQSQLETERRRRRFIFWSIPVAILGGVAWHINQAAGIGSAVTSAALIVGGWSVAMECLYQSGFQRMKGAMVLDRRIASSDREEVEEQKAHGDARLATELEVQAAALGGARQSSVHDQEF
jgi:hypothetical protein